MNNNNHNNSKINQDSKNELISNSELNSVLEINLELERLNIDKHSKSANDIYDVSFQTQRLLSNGKKINQDLKSHNSLSSNKKQIDKIKENHEEFNNHT